jgi:hypothetical protein
MLGTPNQITLDKNDSYDLMNPYYAAFLQDDWRVNHRLTLNLGLRYEDEGGFVERQNRGLGGGFTFGEELPISAAAESAYLRSPIPGLAAIEVAGGNTYLGLNGAPGSVNDAQQSWAPRLGAVFKANARTIIRGGYGLFFDTNNVLNEINDIFGFSQFGYSRSTSTIITENQYRARIPRPSDRPTEIENPDSRDAARTARRHLLSATRSDLADRAQTRIVRHAEP